MQKIKINGLTETREIDIGNDPRCFANTTVEQLKEKIFSSSELKSILQNGRLKFDDAILQEKKTLSFYGIKNNSTLTVEKYYDPEKNFGLKFRIAPDSITNEDNGQLRAVLSCGHAVEPNSLTTWCRKLIDDGKLDFYCPAIINESTNKKCDKKWGYSEIKKIALLSEAEMEYFERKISENAARTFVDYKECPNCKSFVERIDLKNLRVVCRMCQAFHSKKYEFCWQCEREWTVQISTASDTCGRENCTNSILQLLKECNFIKLSECHAGFPDIPSIRACPTCGKNIEHSGQACKNMLCPRCNVEFCFACLETTAACQRAKPSSWFSECAKPVAPIQTKIPVWNRNLN